MYWNMSWAMALHRARMLACDDPGSRYKVVGTRWRQGWRYFVRREPIQ